MLKRLWTSLFFLMIGLASVSSTANSAGLPVVVDAHGKVVGTLIDPGTVIRKVAGAFAVLPVSTEGFSIHDITVMYASSDCTGTKYMGTQGVPNTVGVLPEGSTGNSGEAQVYYPATPWRIIHVRSYQTLVGSPCEALPKQSPTRAGVLTSRVLSFTPPFKLQ